MPLQGGEVDDEHQITFNAFELTISAVVHSSYPPASFQAHADEPIAFNEALANALQACGLEGRLEEVAAAFRAFVRPRFEKTVVEFEAMRRAALEGDA